MKKGAVPMGTTKLIVIKTFDNELDAEVAKQHLHSRGIQAIVSKDDCGGQQPWLQQQLGVDLKVSEADVGRAEQVLKAMMV